MSAKILKPRFRFFLYVGTAIISALLGYAHGKGWIGEPEVALWAGLSAIVNGLSAANVNTPEK